MIFLILLLALALRLILIGQSFWLDEAASLLAAKLSLPQLLQQITSDFHPPLYYLILHFWLKLGNTQEYFLRLPNVLIGVLTIFVLYKLVLLIFKNTRLALVSSLLLALNPFHIYYSQELRMYALNGLLSLTSWFYLTSHLKKSSSRQLFLFGLFTLLNLYTFYGSFLNLLTQIIYVAIWHKKSYLQFLQALFSH